MSVNDMDIMRIAVGLEKYTWIMEHIYATDVSQDLEFQKKFNGFYRMRQRPASFYKLFFTYLEQNKNNKNLTYSAVLNYLYLETGAIHASFGSKLLATVNPTMPVWDQFVLKNLGLKKPNYNDPNRLEKTVQLYHQICDWYLSDEANEQKKIFEQHFPDIHISDTKKADFVLWATRD